MTDKSLNLLADIGGTNTRVALAHGGIVDQSTIRRYRNTDYPGLESVLRKYVAEMDGVDADGACVAVAGPVRDGKATLTNVDWAIDGPTLMRATGAETVSILNDLQAQGHALGHLPDDKLRQIVNSSSTAGPHAARMVVGVGTGFNIASVFETATGRLVPPSESGHANLPIRTEQELRLCHFVSSSHGFPAVEDVLSGRGLERLYAFLGHEADDPREVGAAEIMEALAAGTDPRAEEAARAFTRILGTVCGNLSLIQLPFGGLFLAGGVARAFAPYLIHFGFGDAFRDKGRFAGFMNNFAVSVIEDDYAALVGCAAHLHNLMQTR